MLQEPFVSPSDLVTRLPSGRGLVGFDLEADSLYRYAERICLIQVCFGEEVLLIDPLEDQTLEPLAEWLRSAEIWMHGADYDMSLMLKQWGFVPPVLFDTQIAAQLLGIRRFGYASLVEHFFGVELSKSSQKADWGKRPLSEKMLSYAINDVRYLLPLADEVEKRLRNLDRFDWFLESCNASRDRVIYREGQVKESWRIAGSGKLNPRGLSFLKALWCWRDREAEAWNKPTFMVSGNKQLIAWAETLARGKKVELPDKLRPDRRRRLHEAIQVAVSLPEDEWPSRPQRERSKKDPLFEKKLKDLMEHRDKIATELDIECSTIASRPNLEQIIGQKAEPAELLLKWQLELLDLK